jgi:hypothetical protein
MEACNSCQPNNKGKIIVCKIPSQNRNNMFNMSGKCRDMNFIFNEDGSFITNEYHCGPCQCENIGDKDSDGDGVCDRKDKCPDDPDCK